MNMRQKEEHVFSQGLWVALRLDLLQWFMPLPDPAAATGDHNADIVDGEEESTERRSGSRAAHASGAAATSLASGSIAAARVSEPEHASIVDLITAVSASADARGFALATWRGAENRDGFVLDIDRLVGLRALFLPWRQ